MDFNQIRYLKVTLIGIIVLAIAYISVCFEVVRIQSNSMLPTFREGEFIKLSRVIFPRTQFLRGQIVKFDTPSKPNVLKRVIAIAGDIVMVSGKDTYLNKKSIGHFEVIERHLISHGEYDQDGYPLSVYYSELDNGRFNIALTGVVPEYEENYFIQPNMPPGQWFIPEGYVFVMGDNRDFSYDSRYFGLVSTNTIDAYSKL